MKKLIRGKENDKIKEKDEKENSILTSMVTSTSKEKKAIQYDIR